MGNAGFAHASLSSEQNMVAGANLRLQDFQLGFAVKKIVAAHPAAGGGLHGQASCQQFCGTINLNKIVVSLDIFWIKDQSITDADSLPPPDVLAVQIAGDLEEAQEQFQSIAARLARSIPANELVR